MNNVSRPAQPLHDSFKGSSQPPQQAAPDPSRAFAPDELEIGSIVFGFTESVLGNLTNGFRPPTPVPMLVNGLWRQDDDVKKLEVMLITKNRHGKVEQTPSDYAGDTRQVTSAGREVDGCIKTFKVIILNNDKNIFPFNYNPTIKVVKPDIWPDLLVRRAHAVVYDSGLLTRGERDHTLVREGFTFPEVPGHAIISKNFVPEVSMRPECTIPQKIMPQDEVDRIVNYAVRHTEQNYAAGIRVFSFPPEDEWPQYIKAAHFPNWQKKFTSSLDRSA